MEEITTVATSLNQSLPQTGEEFALTGIILGAIILIIAVVVIALRNKNNS